MRNVSIENRLGILNLIFLKRWDDFRQYQQERFSGTSSANMKMSSHSSSRHPRGSRCILSTAQVLDIFRLKTFDCEAKKRKGAASAKAVAKIFGISSKTVRDIWMGRTWYRATHHLEPSRVDAAERLEKRPGRPKGAKDSKPRIRKHMTSESEHEDHTLENCAVNHQISASRVKEDRRGSLTQLHCRVEMASNHYQIDFKHQDINDVVCVASIHKTNQEQSFQPSWDIGTQDFVDPFHDDWHYWQNNTAPRSGL